VLRKFVDEHPGQRVRIIGEPIWPSRRPDEIPACVQHEALINTVFADHASTILCPYDAVRLDPGVLAYASRTHPVVIRDGSRQPSPSYTDPAVVVGAFNQPLSPPRTVTTDLVFDAGGLRNVRRLVAERAAAAGLPESRIADLQLAVHEIAANTITHATGSGAVRVWIEPDRIVCEVDAPGQIADLLAGRVRPPDDSERGRGLLVANQLCDLVQTHTGAATTVTRLHMRRPSA
jgi:anti-sigma regulatory factor (Ser/Thr protein kinase)